MGEASSRPVEEEDDDINFNETSEVVPVPPDPMGTSSDEGIEENIEGATAISITNVKSVKMFSLIWN